MRILYFSFVELDMPNACQTHTLGVLRGFSQNGCRIDALVPRPIKVRPVIPAVRFYYLWPWRFSRNGENWIKFLSFMIMLFLCLKNRYDAIYVREMESNPVPRICSKIFRIPLYLEVNDLIPLVLKENKSFSKRILRASKCQKLDLVHSAGLIVPSVPMCNWLIKEYMLPRDKVHLILNGADKPINNKLSKKEARKKLGISSNCFCLVFVGNIYPGYDFKTILEAVTECKKNILHIRLIIIGNGPLLDKVKNDTSIMEMNGTVIFTGYIPEERLGKILPAADAGLLLRTKKGALRYGPISTKLSTYFAYNLPVVTAGWSLKDYPNEFVQGIYLIPPENASALAGKILHIYNNPKESIKRAKMLNKFALENLTWNVVADHILNVIQQDLK